MSIVRAKTNPYGPATLDIQIEQRADFHLTLGIDEDITDCTFLAKFSTEWSPGGLCVGMMVTPVQLAPTGIVQVSFPSADSLNLSPISPVPRKGFEPRKWKMGGWIFHITRANGLTERLIDGDVFLDRDPCLT